jgi:SAM-dependent methyltransferase
MTTAFEFSGDQELELMALAVRYNNTLRAWVRQGLKPSDKVLDFGAGTGRYCNPLKDAAQLSAVELDQRYHASIQCPVYTNLADAPRDLDLIYAINVLEHIEDDHAIVRQFHEHLKPGGRVKIFVPAHPMLFSKMDERVGHFRRYTKASLKAPFEQAGFRIASCRWFDFLGYFATLVYKPIGDGSFSATSLKTYDRFIFPVSRVFDRLTGGRITGKNLIFEAVKP